MHYRLDTASPTPSSASEASSPAPMSAESEPSVSQIDDFIPKFIEHEKVVALDSGRPAPPPTAVAANASSPASSTGKYGWLKISSNGYDVRSTAPLPPGLSAREDPTVRESMDELLEENRNSHENLLAMGRLQHVCIRKYSGFSVNVVGCAQWHLSLAF